jgi:SagB-type dehydrogenase family enzyme
VANRDTAAASAYHEATKHSVASVQRSRHFLDFDNMPLPFKVYPELAAIPLPRDVTASARPALTAIAADGRVAAGGRAAPDGQHALDLATLAHLLHFTAGVLRRRAYPGGEAFFRAQACTGNLHHIDLYLVCGPLADLTAGVYHFGPHDFALRLLRAGDHRAAVVAATADHPAVATAPVVVACTSTFWRNAWKYQTRTYRHCFWDDGTLLANLFAVAAALEVPAHLVLGFVDTELNRLLDLDDEREVTLSLVALGVGAAPAPPAPPVAPLGHATLPLSAHEVRYPAITAAHAASSLCSADEVRAWRTPHACAPRPAGSAPLVPLLPSLEPPHEPIESVILRRGSTRVFGDDAIGFDVLSSVLRTITQGITADVPGSDASDAGLTDLYLIVNAVEGLASGTYRYDHARNALALLRAGDFRRAAGHLDLDQPLAADAAVDLYWLADLGAVFEELGNRGYRAAQLEAAIRGGKAYLAAFALGIGATGLTFYDDEVTELFAPDAAGKSVMFLVALGRPRRRRDDTA